MVGPSLSYNRQTVCFWTKRPNETNQKQKKCFFFFEKITKSGLRIYKSYDETMSCVHMWWNRCSHLNSHYPITFEFKWFYHSTPDSCIKIILANFIGKYANGNLILIKRSPIIWLISIPMIKLTKFNCRRVETRNRFFFLFFALLLLNPYNPFHYALILLINKQDLRVVYWVRYDNGGSQSRYCEYEPQRQRLYIL